MTLVSNLTTCKKQSKNPHLYVNVNCDSFWIIIHKMNINAVFYGVSPSLVASLFTLGFSIVTNQLSEQTTLVAMTEFLYPCVNKLQFKSVRCGHFFCPRTDTNLAIKYKIIKNQSIKNWHATGIDKASAKLRISKCSLSVCLWLLHLPCLPLASWLSVLRILRSYDD